MKTTPFEQVLLFGLEVRRRHDLANKIPDSFGTSIHSKHSLRNTTEVFSFGSALRFKTMGRLATTFLLPHILTDRRATRFSGSGRRKSSSRARAVCFRALCLNG